MPRFIFFSQHFLFHDAPTKYAVGFAVLTGKDESLMQQKGTNSCSKRTMYPAVSPILTVPLIRFLSYSERQNGTWKLRSGVTSAPRKRYTNKKRLASLSAAAVISVAPPMLKDKTLVAKIAPEGRAHFVRL